jgi:hypothetical protein
MIQLMPNSVFEQKLEGNWKKKIYREEKSVSKGKKKIASTW